VIPSFDIFQVEPGGGVRWLAAAASLEDAQARVQQLAAKFAGEYVVVNQKNGSKMIFRPIA
jgi:hypothetical protein